MKKSRITIALDKVYKSQSKSEFGTSWAVFRDPANGKYLICERAEGSNNAGQWGFPGGGVDEGEDPKVACRRETKEEILVVVPLSAFHAVISQDATDTIWYEVFMKIAPKKTAEVSRWAWVYPFEMDEYDLHKSVRHYFKVMAGQTKRGAE